MITSTKYYINLSKDVSDNSAFSWSIIQVLIDLFWKVHQDQGNVNKTPDSFQVGNISKSHVQVHPTPKKY